MNKPTRDGWVILGIAAACVGFWVWVIWLFV
jgi:hypothetical protein